MAKGRIRNRMELRAEYDAAEARERAEREGDEEEADEAEEAEEAPSGDADEEGAAPVKAKKKKAPAKEARPRKKATKSTRKRVVWVVFDNSNKRIQSFEYTRKTEAEEMAARLTTEKKSTYFVQPVKEDME